MNEPRLKAFETLIHKLRTNRTNLRDYLMMSTDYGQEQHTQEPRQPITSTLIVTGTTSFGRAYKFDFKIPDILITPPQFDESMYPLNMNQTSFSDTRPYNYLCNFDWYNFLKIKDQGIVYQAVYDLIKQSSQTRFSNIWVNLAAVFYYFREFKVGSQLEAIMRRILANWDDFPFVDTWDGFDYVLPKTSTMWPLLLYSYLSVCFDLICDNVTEIEAILCFQNHLDDARIAYQDTKLAKKGAYMLWMKEACHNLDQASVPLFNVTKHLIGKGLKRTREIFYKDERESKRKQMAETLNVTFFRYLTSCFPFIKTPEHIIKLETVCACARDDRTFYGTLMELAMAKAIKPKIHGDIVPNPIATEWIARDETLLLSAVYPSGTVMKLVQDFGEKYYDLLRERMDTRNPSASFMSFLSTSSAGKKIVIPMKLEPDKYNLPPELMRLLEKGSNKRVIQEAFNASQYKELMPLIKDIADKTTIVSRKQVERRMRAIAGLSNNKLKLNHPVYEANKQFSALATAPSHGKQTGSAKDLHDLLYYTTMSDVCISSIDVAGMDTSIQVNTALHQSIGAIKILEGLTYDVGPFSNETLDITSYDGTVTQRVLSGAQQAIAYSISQFSQVTTYKSKFFGSIDNKEGTFPSGLLTTSNHHTQLLTLAIEALKVQYNNIRSDKIAIQHLQILGDDVVLYFGGTDDEIDSFIEYMVQNFEHIGLELERDESRNFGTFLQQQVVLGRYSGFANRITMFTREDYKTRKSVREGMMELNALFDDILSRTYNATNLVKFQRIFSYFVLSKYVMLIKDELYLPLVKILSKHINVYEYEKRGSQMTRTRFIGFQIPYVYFQMHGGGEMAADSYLRKDGSYTYEQSAYTPRGSYLRRLLYDISGGSVLDNEWLSSYNFHIADFLIRNKWLELQRDMRKETIDEGIVFQLANQLESLEGDNRRHKSRQAYGQLLVEGIKVQRSGVYGFQLQERIRTVLMDIQESDYEMRHIGAKMFDIARQLFGRIYIGMEASDKNHIFTLKYNDQFHISRTERSNWLSNVALAKNMQPFSDAWMLYVHMKDDDTRDEEFSTAIGHSEGHFKNFKYDRDLFTKSLEILRKYGRGSYQLTLFFDAVNVHPSTRPLWIRAMIYFERYKEYVYPYSINPRRSFFLSNDPNSIASLINPLTLDTKVNVRALRLRQAYAYLLSHPMLIVGKLFDFVHDRVF